MSWDAYISNLETAGCKFAAIVGLDSSFWAGNFSPSADEIRILVKLATKGGETSNGIRLGGWDYTVVSMEVNENIKLKRKNCSPEEKYFVYCGVTKKAIVIGAVPTGANERNCCVVVAGIQDYLINANY